MPLKPNASAASTQSHILTEAEARLANIREAYEDGMPLHVLCRRFHLSDSEAQDVAPEEFEHDEQAGSVSGY